MTHFIGLDAHYQSSTLVVLDSKGEQIDCLEIPTNERALRLAVGKIKGPKALTFEESGMARWLYATLLGTVDRLVVCNPSFISKKTGAKTDYIDAKHLANELRCDNLKSVYHNQHSPLLDLRVMIASYANLNKELVQAKNRYKAVFRSEGLKTNTHGLYVDESRIAELPSAGKQIIAMSLIKTIAQLETFKEDYKRHFRLQKKENAHIRILTSIPGIDIVRATTIAAIVGDPKRFKNKHHFWSYSSLINHRQISGGTTYGYKKARGRAELKNVFIGAAESNLISSSSALRKFYDQQRAIGLDHRSAKKNVARKIASISLRLMKTGEKFDEKFIDIKTITLV